MVSSRRGELRLHSEASMRFCILVLVIVVATPRAHAEFVLVPTSTTKAGAGVAPLSLNSTTPKSKSHAHRKPPAPDPPVMGFGNQIPLTFAVRQIVPAKFQVAFGKEVDREQRVGWKGGKPWRSALSEALKPLGLTIDVHGLTVSIVEADAPR
jgi:hypothetical protein